jgi:MoaA/NifB/PqqE/SkfB family radical SAM enzyme
LLPTAFSVTGSRRLKVSKVSALLDTVRLEVQQHFHRIRVLPIVVLYLNNICDSRCKTCSIWKNNELLKVSSDRQMAEGLLEELYERLPGWRPKQILLSGGEPLLHPQFPDAVRRFRDIAGKVCVITNGLLLSSHDATVLEPADEFYISFDAPDADAYQKIRGVDGFGRLAAGLQVLKGFRHPPKIVARCTIQRDNVRRIPELLTVARKLAFDSISFLAVDISSRAFSRDTHGVPDPMDVRPSIEDLEVLETDLLSLANLGDHFVEGGPDRLHRILQYLRALIGEDEFPAVRCNAPWTSVVIETTGKIRSCFFHPVIGDFRDINGETAVEFRRRLNVAADPTCQRCVCSKFISTNEFVRM